MIVSIPNLAEKSRRNSEHLTIFHELLSLWKGMKIWDSNPFAYTSQNVVIAI